MLYTAQFRYPGKDRKDITVKSGDKSFAPTWDMVMGVKEGRITEQQYAEMYLALLTSRYETSNNMVEACCRVVEDAIAGDVTLVCYCPSGAFCHRHLLTYWLTQNWKVVYAGERLPQLGWNVKR